MLTKTPAKRRTSQEESVSQTIAELVGDCTDTPVNELPPLYDSVDPDALNTMVRRGGDDLRIAFRFAGQRIVVEGDGSVTVQSD